MRETTDASNVANVVLTRIPGSPTGAPMSPFGNLTALTTLPGRVRAWPVATQQGARRNAMIACTALAARRAEREDVEDFLASLAPRRGAQHLPVAAQR